MLRAFSGIHKLFMFYFCCFFVGFKSIFGINKTSKVNSFVVFPYGGYPFICRRTPSHSLVSASVIGSMFGIAAILASIAYSKIAYLVVRWVSIYVVNFIGWTFAIMPKPDKLMPSIKHAINAHNIVSIRLPVATSSASSRSAFNSYFSIKYTIISKCKKFFKSILRGFHIVSPTQLYQNGNNKSIINAVNRVLG